MPAAIPPSYDEVPRDVIATERIYPSGFVHPRHTHERGQFAYAAQGAMTVSTAAGNWVVPSQCAVWLPADVPHEMRMSGQVRMLNAFIDTRLHETGNKADNKAGDEAGALPRQCCVQGTTPLLRNLMSEAVLQPALYAPMSRAERIMALLVDEIAAMPPLALNAPLPEEPRLAALCREVLAAPSTALGLDEAARRAGLSRRSFTRLFREQLGTSFVAWREQACLLAVVARLTQGDSVTRVAYDLGYGSPTAFSTMFKRVMGVSPHHYVNGKP
ncbi:AraC family transcriptional regulator [Paraburkholderia unamae]|uniref:AraC family transcriptional regulator n=1 Tax=Paraburkholderia unamae TaxID=219649 RepID=A0ABX5KN73_9BURK|nr:helix-turn-helix transcriptional regulator [Paraburkholderia unamae]PVX82675.1 AraC family transcriptional regulator [Paraburkholderia unamae]CAG9267622.1 AraC family transcriptional regulator [Paraburkholderia unamae]